MALSMVFFTSPNWLFLGLFPFLISLSHPVQKPVEILTGVTSVWAGFKKGLSVSSQPRNLTLGHTLTPSQHKHLSGCSKNSIWNSFGSVDWLGSFVLHTALESGQMQAHACFFRAGRGSLGLRSCLWGQDPEVPQSDAPEDVKTQLPPTLEEGRKGRGGGCNGRPEDGFCPRPSHLPFSSLDLTPSSPGCRTSSAPGRLFSWPFLPCHHLLPATPFNSQSV